MVVAGDALRLTQVFTNLLINAGEAQMPVAIRAAVRKQGERAMVTAFDRRHRYSVRPSRVVFDMFTQVDRSVAAARGFWHRIDPGSQSGRRSGAGWKRSAGPGAGSSSSTCCC